MADELISRQALLNDLQAAADHGGMGMVVAQTLKRYVKRCPAVDAVEVVRCEDCKYLYCFSAIDRQFYCRHWPKGLEGINVVEEKPFCSYGERKEGAGNG